MAKHSVVASGSTTSDVTLFSKLNLHGWSGFVANEQLEDTDVCLIPEESCTM